MQIDQLISLNAPAPGGEDGCIVLMSSAGLAAGGGVEVDRAAGVIKNVSLISIGPALGHGFNITRETLETVLACMKANDNSKSRITHPERQWKDPILCTVGRPTNARLEGDAIRADIKLLDSASKMPGLGDVRGWLLDTAKEDPRIMGISIVARFDFVEKVDPATGQEKEPKVLCKYFHAADFVGDPAANRNGLLSAPANAGDHNLTDGRGTMKFNAAQIEFLQSKGLSKDAAESVVNVFVAALSEADKVKLNSLATPAAAPAGGAAAGAATAPAAGTTLNTPPPTQAAAPAALTEQQRQEIALAERTRINEITALAATLGIPDALRNTAIGAAGQPGQSVEQFRLAALQNFAERHQAVPGLSTRITGGEDGRASLAQGVEDALFLSYGGQFGANQQPHARHTEFMGRTLMGVARQFLAGLGVSSVNMSDIEVAKTVMSRRLLSQHLGVTALMHGTSDFPNILANTLRKRMMAAYMETESTWEEWANTELVNDFKEVRANQLGHVATPPKVLEGATYTYGTVGEKGEVYSVAKYGILISFTWEMLINDDLRAFTRNALGFSAAAKRLENDIMYALLTGNQTMTEDSVALFHSSHSNLNAGGGAAALGATSLKDMKVAMRKQKGISPDGGTTAGPVLAIRPAVLLVPEELEVAASILIASAVKVGGTNAEPNTPFIRNLKLVSEVRLSDDSDKHHYLVGPKNGPVETGIGVKLRGHERPFIEEQDAGVATDGRVYKMRHVFGGRIMDFRGFQLNEGA